MRRGDKRRNRHSAQTTRQMVADMFGSNFLEIATGLVFICLSIGLVCSSITNAIAWCLDHRGKTLCAGIENLLDDPSYQRLAQQFYSHGLTPRRPRLEQARRSPDERHAARRSGHTQPTRQRNACMSVSRRAAGSPLFKQIDRQDQSLRFGGKHEQEHRSVSGWNLEWSGCQKREWKLHADQRATGV